jgi:hypothetical protein
MESRFLSKGVVLVMIGRPPKGGFIGREGVGWTVGFGAFGNGALRWRLRVIEIVNRI